MSIAGQVTRSLTTTWLVLALNVGVSFFLSPFVVSKLGSTYYGIWAIALQFTGYLYLLDFGVRESVIRYTSKYAARRDSVRLNGIVSAALAVYLPIALVCVALTLVCAWYAPSWFDIADEYAREAQLAILFTGLTIAQTFLFNVFTGIVQGMHRFDVANVIAVAATIPRTILVIVALALGYKLVALAAIHFAIAMLAGLAGMVAALHILRAGGLKFSFGLARRRRSVALMRRVFGYGFYVFVNNVAQKINFASDAVVIGLFLPVAFVTPYAIAGSLVDYLRQLLAISAQVFSPLSSQLYTERRADRLADLLVRGSKLVVLITLPISVVFALLGDQFIGLWMGQEYAASAGQILLVLGLLQILSGPHYVVSSVLYGMSKHRLMGFLRIAEAAAKLLLSIALVNTLGIVGVAIATATAHSVLVIILLPWLVRRAVGLRVSRYFAGAYLRPLVAVAPFALVTWWLDANVAQTSLVKFFVEIAAACCLYAGTVYAIALDEDERMLVRRLLPRRRAKAG